MPICNRLQEGWRIHTCILGYISSNSFLSPHSSSKSFGMLFIMGDKNDFRDEQGPRNNKIRELELLVQYHCVLSYRLISAFQMCSATIVQSVPPSTDMIRLRIRTDNIHSQEEKCFYILCRIRRNVVHTSSSSVSISLSTHVGVQSVFFYLQWVSKTLVPSSRSGAKTFLKGKKTPSHTNLLLGLRPLSVPFGIPISWICKQSYQIQKHSATLELFQDRRKIMNHIFADIWTM